jgi:hypothetical protein
MPSASLVLRAEDQSRLLRVEYDLDFGIEPTLGASNAANAPFFPQAL